MKIFRRREQRPLLSTARSFARSCKDSFLSLAPPCWGCEAPSWKSVCLKCLDSGRLSKAITPHDSEAGLSFLSEFSYSKWGEKVLWHYKERSSPEVISEIIPHLRVPIQRDEVDALIYVASDPVSNRRRFFDPSEELARQLSRAWSIPLVSKVFHRIPQMFAQKDLSRQQRRLWASRLISIRSEKLAGYERVLLVDDLVTTGETLRAHIGLLKAIGVKVKAWTLFQKF